MTSRHDHWRHLPFLGYGAFGVRSPAALEYRATNDNVVGCTVACYTGGITDHWVTPLLARPN
jgi:hypothetical protein